MSATDKYLNSAGVANLWACMKGVFLAKDNTVEYTPTASYHPATKGYVDTGLTAKAPLASPALTGNPTAPTQAVGNSSTRLATTAFVGNEIPNKTGISSKKGQIGNTVYTSGSFGYPNDTVCKVYGGILTTNLGNGWVKFNMNGVIWCANHTTTYRSNYGIAKTKLVEQAKACLGYSYNPTLSYPVFGKGQLWHRTTGAIIPDLTQNGIILMNDAANAIPFGRIWDALGRTSIWYCDYMYTYCNSGFFFEGELIAQVTN